ncbi:MAG: protoheme IX farnesyltransferase [Chlorobi bacterium]|nr:protoheme IX farnesyltransferase [Chlorobiota bacterium]
MSYNIKSKIKDYWQLIKSLQTFLLLLTGITGFLSSRCPYTGWETFVLMIVSLFLAISGTTVYNMVYDRKIDAKMNRTKNRPIPSGRVSVKEAVILGTVLNVIGLGIAFWLSPLYALVVFAGLFIDFIVYTVWLKQRSPWSIVWGGISGGMPILAGRVLGTGEIDMIGIFLALSILFWIPTHIMTFNMKYFDDYKRAGVPTFPEKYGFKKARIIIAVSTVVSAVTFAAGAFFLGIEWGFIRVLILLAVVATAFAVYGILKPSDKMNFRLFKLASLNMLFAMIIIILGSIYY